MTYSESLRLLLSLERLGMKFGLQGIRRLVHAIGEPQKEFPSIHIAGTNGKGSTASMLAAVFTAAGYKTGLYTSPHLVRLEERIRVDGKSVSEKAVAHIVGTLRPMLRKYNPTFFEATTALAFKYFAEKKVDIAIVETGLGGRLDSTNILKPHASVITNIGLEHTEILGDSIEAIALEKAGIIKKNTVCVSGVKNVRALKVLRQECRKYNAFLADATGYRIKERNCSLQGSLLDVAVGDMVFERLFVSLAGRYQYANLAVALETLHQVQRMKEFEIRDEAVREGLANVQRLAGLTGRLATVHEKPRVIIDVAHNADATVRLVESLKHLVAKKATVVFGVMKDKDYRTMVRHLASITDQAIAVAARSERSRSASDVAAAFAGEGCRVRAALSVHEGIHLALETAGKNGLVLVTGSHFVVGEALPVLGLKRA